MIKALGAIWTRDLRSSPPHKSEVYETFALPG
jgi:hypothetical protein